MTAVIGVVLYYMFSRSHAVLAVMSFGYGILQRSLTDAGSLTAGLLLAIAIGKILTTSLTIGSGGSGGVFGPSMVIGGCGGGALGIFLHANWPGLVARPESFIILGMAGFFAAAAKTPFSTLVIVSEMTADYQMLLPALWVCTLAYLLSDEQSLYASQVARRSLSPAHQGSYVREVLAGLRVKQFLNPSAALPMLHAEEPLNVVLDRLASSAFTVLPVVDANQNLLGVVNLDEVHLASRSPHVQQWLLAEDLMRPVVNPLHPEDRLDEALETFVENDLLAMPVVAGPDSKQLIGMIRRSEIAQAYLQHVHGQSGVDSDASIVFGPAGI